MVPLSPTESSLPPANAPLPIDNNDRKTTERPGGGHGSGGGGGSGVREQDRYMPIANVIRIMRRILPTHAKISDDAKETIQECVSEYISFITGEANDRCQQEQRKTITAEDVLWAMGKLGFDDYVEPLTIFLSRYREIEGDRAGHSLRSEAFYLNRRGNASNTGGMDYYYGPPLLPPPPPTLGMLPPYAPPHHQAMGYVDPSAAAAMGTYYGVGSSTGSGSSSANSPSQANLAGFDPFAPFKN
ncbi:nuclear transcription factor Y subunit B-3-like [Rhodamnia argentea]|uniref:Nuclear transcription factor Y subunit B-3-like n=1 Tax=Rhodamnia argentea TaxID=178133 RepID=A0A8B8P0P1_9MYRT|nr:nuclear transcription factor Y subunit B-3-like [Rhodamnia argentea]